MAGSDRDDRSPYKPSAQAFMEPNSNDPGVSSDSIGVDGWFYHDHILTDTPGLVQPDVCGDAFDQADSARSANVSILEPEPTPRQQYFEDTFPQNDTAGFFDDDRSVEMLADSTTYGANNQNVEWCRDGLAATAASGNHTDRRYPENASTDTVYPASIDPSLIALYGDTTLTTSCHQEAPRSMADYSADLQPVRVDSWSAFNTRSDEMYLSSSMKLPTLNGVHASDLASTNLSVEYDESSVPESNPATSRTTFEDDVNLATPDLSTYPSNVQEIYQMQPTTYLNAMMQTQGPLASLPLRLVQSATNIEFCVREGTPPQEPTGYGQVINIGGFHPGHGLCPGPRPVLAADSNFLREPSTTSSPSPSQMSIDSSLCSVASASVPLLLSCDKSGCTATFSGNYRKGNLARHKRVVHERAREYVCEAPGCARDFRRSDARRKHYTKYHPHLLASQPRRDLLEHNRDYGSVS